MKKEKCEQCKMVHGGFHICIDLSTPEPVPPPRVLGEMADDHRRSISEAQRERWAKIHEENAERNEKILDRYREGNIGYKDLAVEFGINATTMYKILKKAQAEGLITIRSRGDNIKKRTREGVNA